MKIGELFTRVAQECSPESIIDSSGIRFFHEGSWYNLCLYEDSNEKPIVWSVEDFKQQADNICDGEWEEKYDETKFSDALEKMIEDHDACWGINWETVNRMLWDFCKKEER